MNATVIKNKKRVIGRLRQIGGVVEARAPDHTLVGRYDTWAKAERALLEHAWQATPLQIVRRNPAATTTGTKEARNA